MKLTHVQRSCPNISPAFTFSFITIFDNTFDDDYDDDDGENKLHTYMFDIRVVYNLNEKKRVEKRVINLMELFVCAARQSHMVGNINNRGSITSTDGRRTLIFVLIIFEKSTK